ncbi:3-oxoacyl-[acyl-carrier-protein] reductase FabG-like isoform X1 [Clytia hemisphaerica]|uniref:3-oxoacyl-[acyl-carrier-protein] reductase FabG-like isoform X1 n=1 Tax=Clytia hemisphaerica TaxID=252671 RepID=UPI0034D76CBE
MAVSSGALAGKISLVTGAATGIGRAVCELFAKEGATVIGVGLQNISPVIENLPKNTNLPHLALECDVSSEESIKQTFAEILKEYNQTPTIAVNSAGITKDSFLIKQSEKDFDDVINVNLKGTFFITKHLCGYLIKNKVSGGSIVNIASIVGKVGCIQFHVRVPCAGGMSQWSEKTGNIGQANYTASKAGVVGLTKTTALELARFNVRCNAVLPGFITTAMTDKVPQPVRDQVCKMIPMQTFGQPQDIAEACLFLASDKSRYITGTTLEVAGGLGA